MLSFPAAMCYIHKGEGRMRRFLKYAVIAWLGVLLLYLTHFLFHASADQPSSKKNYPPYNIKRISPVCHATGSELLGPPQIKDVYTEESFPEAGKTVKVVVETLDGKMPKLVKKKRYYKPVKIVEGSLYYSVNGGNSWEETPLNRKKGKHNTWDGVVPPFPKGTTVLYYTRFRDMRDRMATEMKPDFQDGLSMKFTGGKKFLFPDERYLTLTYENNGIKPPYMPRELEKLPAGVLEKLKVQRTFISQDEGFYYFVVEFEQNVSEILKLSGILPPPEVSVNYWIADKVDKSSYVPDYKDFELGPYGFSYWLALPTYFSDTKESNCVFCLWNYGAMTYADSVETMPEGNVKVHGNRVYMKVEQGIGTGVGVPHVVVKLETAVCVERETNPYYTQTVSWTPESYVYVRTHSYEL